MYSFPSTHTLTIYNVYIMPQVAGWVNDGLSMQNHVGRMPRSVCDTRFVLSMAIIMQTRPFATLRGLTMHNLHLVL